MPKDEKQYKNTEDKIEESILAQRRVFLSDAVDQDTAKSIIRKLWYLESIDPKKPILFVIGCWIYRVKALSLYNKHFLCIESLRGGKGLGKSQIRKIEHGSTWFSGSSSNRGAKRLMLGFLLRSKNSTRRDGNAPRSKYHQFTRI